MVQRGCFASRAFLSRAVGNVKTTVTRTRGGCNFHGTSSCTARRLGRRCQVALTKRTNARTYLVGGTTASRRTREGLESLSDLSSFCSSPPPALRSSPFLPVVPLTSSIRNFSHFVRRYFQPNEFTSGRRHLPSRDATHSRCNSVSPSCRSAFHNRAETRSKGIERRRLSLLRPPLGRPVSRFRFITGVYWKNNRPRPAA